MEHYINKTALVAEIENLIDKGKYHDDYNCAFRDGNNAALIALKERINTIEVKEVDLEKEVIDWWNAHYSEKDYSFRGYVGHYLENSTIISLAKHFFELGMAVSNPITAEDRGTADEIIVGLMQIEKDYHINLEKEIKFVRNKVQKGK